MDLIHITAYIWNIFLLVLFCLQGIVLESIKKNSTTEGEEKTVQLDIKGFDSMEIFRKMSSTVPTTLSTIKKSTDTIPTKTKMLALFIKTTAVTTSTTSKSMKLLSTELNTNKHEKLQNHYKELTKMKINTMVTADNGHEIFKSNMTTVSQATITSNHVVENEEQQTKRFEIFTTDFNNKSYDAGEHLKSFILHGTTNTSRHNEKTLPALENTTRTTLEQKKLLSNLKLAMISTQNPLATAFTTDPFANLFKEQHTLGKLTIANDRNSNKIYINDPDRLDTNGNDVLQRNNYNDSGHNANTLSTTTTLINSFNKKNQATAISTMTTTTAATKLSSLTTKQNHMYDNNSELLYLPYRSAALKSSASDMNTMNKNLNAYSVSSGSSSGSSFKRDTLLSVANILSTAKPAVENSNSMKNSSTNIFQNTDNGENVVQRKHIFKSNNSLAHETQTFEMTVKATPTSSTININETSSSLPFNVSSTNAVISIPEKEMATTTAASETSTPSRTTLKTTARRRKIATTTLKPPPTIDDYQTVTSQAGTHAYLPCNVKQLVKKPISWLRVRDGHILTVDQTTFIADQRFQSIYTVNPERWSLQIKYVQLKDAGIYECQVSTEPKASAIVYLHVVEPKTELIGAPTRHVKAGSQVKLLCIISQALEPPLFINWFYNQKQIYLHNHKGWHTEIERIELPPETTTTTTTTKTTTAANVPSTTTASSTLEPSSSSTFSSTSSSMFNGSESLSAMHIFTSVTPQQSLNDGNLLELVSHSKYNKNLNLTQPEALLTSTSLKTEQSQTTASTISEIITSTETTAAVTETTLPPAIQGTTIFEDLTDDDNDFKSHPSITTFEAIAAQRGYMMLSSLMTFTDVKQITTASLIIPSVQKRDSGNYTCSPSNSAPRTVILHVLNGEYSASAITSNALSLHVKFEYIVFSLSTFTLIYSLLKKSLLNKQNLIEQYSGG